MRVPLSYFEIEGQKGLYRSRKDGRILSLLDMMDFSVSIPVDGTRGSWIAPARSIVLARFIVGGCDLNNAFKIWAGATGATDWCAFRGLTLGENETLLERRVARLENVLAEQGVTLKPFGELEIPFEALEQECVSIELKKPATVCVILSGICRKGP